MPEDTFSIRLVNSQGNPLKNREISVHMGFGYERKHTDNNGWVEFGIYGNTHTGKIYSYEYKGFGKAHSVVLTTREDIYDGATFSFVIDDG